VDEAGEIEALHVHPFGFPVSDLVSEDANLLLQEMVHGWLRRAA
jgi:hypothetical protein